MQRSFPSPPAQSFQLEMPRIKLSESVEPLKEIIRFVLSTISPSANVHEAVTCPEDWGAKTLALSRRLPIGLGTSAPDP